MKDLALNTPTKGAKKIEKLEFDIFDDTLHEESPDTVDSFAVEIAEAGLDPEEVELEELRKQFVGDVDITEGLFVARCIRKGSLNVMLYLDQEPLLIESKRRFVLFPIQYPEVDPTFNRITSHSLTHLYRSGRCTRKLKHPSGLQRRWTSQRISTTGTTG